MLLMFNYNWLLGGFFIAIVTSDSQSIGRGKKNNVCWNVRCLW